MRISVYIGLFFLLIACRKETVTPVGFFEANYYTSPNEKQEFLYYYDDGERVAGGLDDFMVKLVTEPGTFTQQALLTLKMKTNFPTFTDSLLPFTYFIGLNYGHVIEKPIKCSFNLNYPFNLSSHTNYEDYVFFMDNIHKLKLFKLVLDENASLYYNPEFELIEEHFVYDQDSARVTFDITDKNALYVLSWVNTRFSDTLSLQLSGGIEEQYIYNGYKSTSNNQGAYVSFGSLKLDYTPQSFRSTTNTDLSSWFLNELHITIQNPQEGVVNHEQIQLDLLISRQQSGYQEVSRLLLNPTTQVEIVEWPEVNEYGIINISGIMRNEMTQGNVSVNFSVKFKRLR
jgi:hypothetical protein